MSSQRGNSQRNRPQKFKNASAFRNNMHDASKQTVKINQLEMHGLCARCKVILEWKVKYKKYKPLTKPGTCVKCSLRNVKRAYFTVCESCINQLKICGKCGQDSEIVIELPDPKQEKNDKQFEATLRNLRERERRTIFRIMQSGKEGSEGIVAAKLEKQAAADRGDDGSSSFEDDEDSSDAQSEEDEEPVTENSDSEGKEVNKL